MAVKKVVKAQYSSFNIVTMDENGINQTPVYINAPAGFTQEEIKELLKSEIHLMKINKR